MRDARYLFHLLPCFMSRLSLYRVASTPAPTGEDKSQGLERRVGESNECAPLAKARGERSYNVRDDPENTLVTETPHLQNRGGKHAKRADINVWIYYACTRFQTQVNKMSELAAVRVTTDCRASKHFCEQRSAMNLCQL